MEFAEEVATPPLNVEAEPLVCVEKPTRLKEKKPAEGRG
jgi:hypothetical protein